MGMKNRTWIWTPQRLLVNKVLDIQLQCRAQNVILSLVRSPSRNLHETVLGNMLEKLLHELIPPQPNHQPQYQQHIQLLLWSVQLLIGCKLQSLIYRPPKDSDAPPKMLGDVLGELRRDTLLLQVNRHRRHQHYRLSHHQLHVLLRCSFAGPENVAQGPTNTTVEIRHASPKEEGSNTKRKDISRLRKLGA
jgi:hypothetical protein